MNLESVISNFKTHGRYLSSSLINVGHINSTWLINTEDEKYVLQKINYHIFKNVPALMNNILLATEHVAGKIDSGQCSDMLAGKLELIATHDGSRFYKDEAGDYWRLYNFIKGSSYNVIDARKAELAGKAFGKFQLLLADLPASRLFDTIPDFHNLKTRYKTFVASVEKDPFARKEGVGEEIAFVNSRVDAMIAMQELIDSGAIPVRITHNDTKINNILFDADDTPVCIVDLDTVMPGAVLYDFGDAIRTATNTAAEDEADLMKVNMDLKLFEAYTKGYLETAKAFLTTAEIENLALSARYIALIIGLRFLTDYIDGDKYFKVSFPGHNLQRAKAQFRLVKSMEEQYGQMKEIVKKYT